MKKVRIIYCLLILVFTSCKDKNSEPVEQLFFNTNGYIKITGNLALGEVYIGDTANTELELTVTGDSSVNINGFTLPEGFYSNWSSGIVSPSTPQKVLISFIPNEAKIFDAEMTVNYGNNKKYGLVLKGTGLEVPQFQPTISTGLVTNITNYKASTMGEVLSIGTYPIASYGHCWATTNEPTIANAKSVFSSTPVNNTKFVSEISGLSQSANYKVRTYILLQNGMVIYGNQVTFSTETLSNNLLAFYRFDDGTAKDELNNYNGTMKNGVSVNTDSHLGFGNALNLDGIDDYILVNQPIVLTSQGYTMNFWIKTTDRDGGFVGAEGSNYGFCMANGKLGITDSAQWQFNYTLDNTLLDGNWHMLTFTRTSGGYSRYYIDGVNMETENFSLIFNHQLTFGKFKSISSPLFYLKANIDNLRIYGESLSGTSISRLFQTKS